MNNASAAPATGCRQEQFAGAMAAGQTRIAGSVAAKSGIAETWAKAEALWERIERSDGEGDPRDLNDWAGLDAAVIHGQIRSRADAIAKIKAVGMTFTTGHRPDGMESTALADAIRWLETNA